MSTLSNGKASFRSALKRQSNFLLPCVMSKYVTMSVRPSFIVQVQAFNFYFKRDQLLAKNTHLSWIHGIQKIVLSIHKKLSECILF